jgi:hypothetical protein
MSEKILEQVVKISSSTNQHVATVTTQIVQSSTQAGEETISVEVK